MTRLSPLSYEDFRRVWPSMRPVVARIAEREPYEAEDVFTHVSMGHASCYAEVIGDHARVFGIVQVKVYPWERVLHVWVGGKIDGDVDMRELFPDFEAIAKRDKCHRLTFDSHRAGVERQIDGLGCTYHYSKGV